MYRSISWIEFWRGQVVIKLAQALETFSHQCPEHGTDNDLIEQWHYLMPLLTFQVERHCAFWGWTEGVSLAQAINDHFDTANDGALKESWWTELSNLCADLAKAAAARGSGETENDEAIAV